MKIEVIMKRAIILGGGTFNPIRNYLALAAPAFEKAAKRLKELMPEAELALTKKADSSSKLITNKDVKKYLDQTIRR